jgi:hypothetical protein
MPGSLNKNVIQIAKLKYRDELCAEKNQLYGIIRKITWM